MPAHNAEPFIAAAIRSVQSQTFTDWELCVVDDCSTDGTRRIAETLGASDPRIRVVTTEVNSGGPARPRNIGVELARGAWVAFLDADDVWHPQKLELQLEAATRGTSDWVCTRMKDVHELHDGEWLAVTEHVSQEWVSYTSLLMKNRIPCSSVLCRKALIVDAGGFDEHPRIVAVEDYDLWLRLCAGGCRPLALKEPLVYYRVVAGSISSEKSKQFMKVMRVVFARLAADRPWMVPLFPLLILTYVGASIHLRLIQREL